MLPAVFTSFCIELLNAAETLKQQIMNKGRWKICTLKIPWKHIKEIPKDEETEEQDENNDLGNLIVYAFIYFLLDIESNLEYANSIESPKSLRKVAEPRAAETVKKQTNKSLVSRPEKQEENLRTVRVKMKDNTYKVVSKSYKCDVEKGKHCWQGQPK